MGTGRGDTGVVRKTDKAVAALVAGIRGYLLRHADASSCLIKELQFDIFGFSRGAAAARHFANRVFSQESTIIAAIKSGLEGTAFSGTPGGKTRFPWGSWSLWSLPFCNTDTEDVVSLHESIRRLNKHYIYARI